MKTQGNEHIYADVRKSMNSEEFEKSIESVLNDYNVSKEEKVVKLFKLGLYPTDILEYIRVGLAEVYYILDLAKKEGKFNDKLNKKTKNPKKIKNMETKIELIRIEEIIKSIQKENELFNKIMPFIKSIEPYAFQFSNFTGEFICPNLQSIGNGAFAVSQFTGSFICPNLTYIGQYAFVNSKFDTITIGANAILNRGCIGAHSDEFINDYEANGRKAGTYVWNGEHWIYQK